MAKLVYGYETFICDQVSIVFPYHVDGFPGVDEPDDAVLPLTAHMGSPSRQAE